MNTEIFKALSRDVDNPEVTSVTFRIRKEAF